MGTGELTEAREKILQWLSLQANPDSDNHQITRHNRLLTKHHTNTCDWIFEREEFATWSSVQAVDAAGEMERPPLLWLHGKRELFFVQSFTDKSN